MDEENSRSGIFVDAEGRTEYWWNGFNYGCVLPEKLIDQELYKRSKGDLKNGN